MKAPSRPDAHTQRVIDQFTLQALPFSTAPSMRDENALALISSAAGLNGNESVLDVACGPGLLVRHFARRVSHATGVDITPAMLERARQLCREGSVTNASFESADANELPFANNTFDVVTTRFSFHHFESPQRVLREMARVCRVGGRLVVCDAVCPANASGATVFNRVETLRDPSTVRFLAEAELAAMFMDAGLRPTLLRYRVPLELEALMRASFPGEDAAVVRRLLHAQLSDDAMEIQPHLDGGRLLFSYPAVVLSATVLTHSASNYIFSGENHEGLLRQGL